MTERSNLTVLLNRWRDGDNEAAAQLLSEVYDDLHRVAGSYMRRERQNHTLQPTALLNEAWIRLAQQKVPPGADRQSFFRAMAAYMRRHLVDHARRHKADKRGGGMPSAELDESTLAVASPVAEDADLLLDQLDRALHNLHLAHPRARKVVELRVFAGKSVEDVAATLSIGTGTVKRDFTFAKSFLAAELERHRTDL